MLGSSEGKLSANPHTLFTVHVCPRLLPSADQQSVALKLLLSAWCGKALLLSICGSLFGSGTAEARY